MLPALIQDFIALFFPHYCFTCHAGLVKGEQYICTGCRYKLPKTQTHKIQNDPLMERYRGLLPVNHLLAYLKFTKGGKVKKILEKLKYEDCPEIGVMLGRWYGADLHAGGMAEKFELILPVPLHKSKLRKRGYNQSDYFAQGLSETLGISWSPDVLIRKAKSESQTRKGRLERFENVTGIFEVTNEEAVKDKRVLLVDDVITTGATLLASAHPVLKAGCKSVSVAALAVAQ